MIRRTGKILRWTLAAAREKLRSWATARKVFRAAISINLSYCIVMIITLTSNLPNAHTQGHGY